MKLTVVSATFNRARLLDRALATYAKQTLPFDEWEYVLADDASEDDTAEVVERWRARGLPLRYLHAPRDLALSKEPGQWRDGCVVRNAASTHANGTAVLMTHPEIMIPDNALEVMYETLRSCAQETRYRTTGRASWVTAIPYWLPNVDYDALDWQTDLWRLRDAEGFYDSAGPGPQAPRALDYSAHNQERRLSWESEVFWAMSMSVWRRMGGFRPLRRWGSVDMDFLARRHAIGIRTTIAKDPLAAQRHGHLPHHSGNLMVFHQWHDEGQRDFPAAVRELERLKAIYTSPQSAINVGGLTPIYAHGPRERANGGTAGVLRDHVERYRFAARYCSGMTVLDLPCGTGYGAHVLAPLAHSYIGIDADEESLEWARTHYRHPNIVFQSGDMGRTGLEAQSIDQVVSFEGIEHIEDKAGFVDELYRVLRPGGHFVLSTPQKGAAQGTPWDRFMLTWADLKRLFQGDRWTALDSFYQPSYGNGVNLVRAGDPPDTAQIMLLGGTRC